MASLVKKILMSKKQNVGAEQAAISAHSNSYPPFLLRSSGSRSAFAAQGIILKWLLIKRKGQSDLDEQHIGP